MEAKEDQSKIVKIPRDEKKVAKFNVDTIRMVIEDDVELETEGDKNKIYHLLEEQMKEHPGMAAYVADQMSGSLTLEEAQLIGKTALVVYKTVKTLKELETEGIEKPNLS